MITREYEVDGKKVKVEIDVVFYNKPMVVFNVKADPDVIKQYIDNDTLSIAFDLDDIFSAVVTALTPNGIRRD